jgi:hypothetical protein
VPDPAILRYDGGLPVYRYGMAPDELATTHQLRQQRLSPAGLKPAGWLYYNRLHHLICTLYDRAVARPIRSTARSVLLVKPIVGRVGLEPTTGGL